MTTYNGQKRSKLTECAVGNWPVPYRIDYSRDIYIPIQGGQYGFGEHDDEESSGWLEILGIC